MNKDNVKRLRDQVLLCSTRPAMTNTVGRSMVEMLGVLAIIGVLSAGGLAGYSKAMFQHKVNQTVDQVVQTVIKIQMMFINEPEAIRYEDFTTAKAIAYKLIDASKQNAFKGAFEIGDHSNGNFTIYLTLPSNACVSLASYHWGDKDSNFIGIVANPDIDGDAGDVDRFCTGSGQSVGGGYYTCSASMPMPMEYAVEACQCEGMNCEIMLKFQ